MIFQGKKEHVLEMKETARVKDVIEECRASLLNGDESLFVMNGSM